ncbi:hypothetical protein Zmor_005266 [Zophobas morio]|uniref:Uncharacterized protein n=2 Tax=Zophobas morio TaxID=2755281 RepID=A0AA38IRT5_9CUCU|nr:hypothetical protein Zmor_005266 [Zophobas morio]
MLISAIKGIIDGAVPGVDPDETASLRPFLDEVIAIIPLDDLLALVNDKLQNSPDFQDLYTTIASEDGKALVDEVLQMPEAVHIQELLTAQEVDVAGVLAAVYEFFGWGAPPTARKISHRDLLSDFLEIVALLPLDDILAILDEHVASDPAVAAVITYLQSDAWNGLVDEVLAKPTAVEFIDYLNNAGIPVDMLISAIKGIIDGAVPGVDPDETASLRPFLDEVIAIIPLDDLLALVNDKLQNSPDFQDLYTTIASEDGKALVDEVLQMPEAVHIQELLTAQEVDVAGVLAAVYEFFGWGAPPTARKISHRDLLSDFLEIVALLPIDDILAILDEHVASDPAVAAVITYLQSDAWNGLVDEVLAKPTAVEFIDYLNNAGIPVDMLISAIKGIIDGAVPGVDPDETASLRPFLDEVIAIIPLDDLLALVNDKLQNSPDFQDLYTTIASEDGKALVDEVLQMPEAVHIQELLTAQEVDVAGVLAAVYEFFGWGAPPK